MSSTENILGDFGLGIKMDNLLDPEESPPSENEKPLKNPEKELSDEIKSFRKKNEEFQATNDHETYLIVCFSTKKDKDIFLREIKMENEHTIVDGYNMARNLKLNPKTPTIKLKQPLKPTKRRNNNGIKFEGISKGQKESNTRHE